LRGHSPEGGRVRSAAEDERALCGGWAIGTVGRDVPADVAR